MVPGKIVESARCEQRQLCARVCRAVCLRVSVQRWGDRGCIEPKVLVLLKAGEHASQVLGQLLWMVNAMCHTAALAMYDSREWLLRVVVLKLVEHAPQVRGQFLLVMPWVWLTAPFAMQASCWRPLCVMTCVWPCAALTVQVITVAAHGQGPVADFAGRLTWWETMGSSC